MTSSLLRPRMVDVVFGLLAPERRSRLVLAASLGISLHLVLCGWALWLQPSLESWSAAFAARVHAELAHVEVVELAKPPPPPKPETPPVAPPATAAPRRETAKPQPPAQAGAIVAAAPDPLGPVDLTADTFVTGAADAYAGGVTATTGTSAVAVAASAGPTNARAPIEVDRSGPATLADADWSCPWPRDAEADDLSEQVVVMRVVVRADGEVASARLVSDPGHGFGQAAVACALKSRFEPAHDHSGHVIASESPPLRVRFTR